MRNIIRKTTAVATAIAMCAAMSVHAAYSEDWSTVYSQAFDTAGAAADFELNTEKNFSAEVADGALNVKSNNICAWTANDTASFNSTKNAAGLTLLNTSAKIDKLTTPVNDSYGNTFEYVYASDKANFFAQAGGKDALKLFTYAANESGTGFKTNGAHFQADSGLFTAEDNEITIEIEYYLSSNDTQTSLKLNYPHTTAMPGNQWGWMNVSKSNLVTGQWATYKFELTNADFTAAVNKNTGAFMLQMGDASTEGANPISELYIRDVKVYKTQSSPLSYPTTNKTATAKLGENPIYGNTRLSLDVTLPSGKAYSGYYAYNAEENAFSVSLLDEFNAAAATVAFDILGDEAAIYAVYRDSGKDTQEKLAQVPATDIADKAVTITITTDRDNGTFALDLKKDGSSFAEKKDLAMLNAPTASSPCNLQYLEITHNRYSQALYTSFDNIVVEAQENLDYKMCAEEIAAVKEKITEGTVTADFALPTEGLYTDTVISWSSGDAAISIESGESGTTAKVSRPTDADKSVTITAAITCGGCTMTADFTFTVKSLSGIGAQVDTAKEDTNTDGTVNVSLELKYSGTDYTADTDITLTAFAINSKTGEITARAENTQKTSSADKYKTLNFKIENFGKKGGDETRYYLWDENGKPLANMPPAKVTDFSAERKVTSIKLKWNGAGIDDRNAVDYYAVYRDGKLIGVTENTTYTDTAAADLKEHSYGIAAIDLNDNTGETYTKEKVSSLKMFTYALGVSAEDEEEYSLVSKHNPSRGNVQYTTVDDKNKVTSGCVYAAAGIEACFAATKTETDYSFWEEGGITADDRELVLRVTYLDTTGGVMLFYNSVSDGATKSRQIVDGMDNTRLWKTVTVELSDAKFVRGSSVSDFKLVGRRGSAENDLYIKKVEIIQKSKY